MALLRCDFSSDVLGLSTSMTVILPQSTSTQAGLPGGARPGPPPVLYLLHGLGNDDTTWVRRTAIERYVAPLGLAVVMPQVHRSFHADEAHGNRYWTFLSEELPELVAGFRVSDRREDTFVAGLSMGGYGALKWALTHPGRFAAAASLSGGLDPAGWRRAGDWRPDLLDRVFGDRTVAGSGEDLFALVGGAGAGPCPALYPCCGTEDELHEENVRADAARASGAALTVDFGPGEHDGAYCDARIQDVLDWLPLSGTAEGQDEPERRSPGLGFDRGRLRVAEDFDAPLAEEVQAELER